MVADNGLKIGTQKKSGLSQQPCGKPVVSILVRLTVTGEFGSFALEPSDNVLVAHHITQIAYIVRLLKWKSAQAAPE